MGAEIVALSADTPEQARMTVSELGITYPILSDSSRTYIRAYDVLHPQEGIARPSVFVLDRDGMVPGGNTSERALRTGQPSGMFWSNYVLFSRRPTSFQYRSWPCNPAPPWPVRDR